MTIFCCDLQRRTALRKCADDPNCNIELNGIDFVEIRDIGPLALQRRIAVTFVLDLDPALALDETNVQILGGDRIRDIRVIDANIEAANPRNLLVDVDQPGDFSIYTLRLRASADSIDPPPGIDPALAEIDFSFKAACPSDFDCRSVLDCDDPTLPAPDIDYLARDYASMRRLMLDRITTLSPDWRDRSPADVGITLVELLAYVADRLSYRQDAIATEAYLATARSRISVRRHARLVDYVMHDGCNARAWIQLAVNADLIDPHLLDPTVDSAPPVPRGVPLCTGLQGKPTIVDPADLRKADVVFETAEAIHALHPLHNRMPFYTWGDDRCCLPTGSTSATLRGHYPDLRPGQMLIFEEILGPLTGDPSDADPNHRYAVRLSTVRAFADYLPHTRANTEKIPKNAKWLRDPFTETEITEITWDAQDALVFPVCLSARTDARHESKSIVDVSVALGNIVLADHGNSRTETDFPPVPSATRFYPARREGCETGEPQPVRPRYRLRLNQGPLTQAAPIDPNAPSALVLLSDPRAALPVVTLNKNTLEPWEAQLDLLDSQWNDQHIVAEVELDGGTTIRFGDDRQGRFPDPGTTFTASYRVGNGTAGNVGRDTIAHIALNEPAIVAVRNPLPATGGIDPESIEEVRQKAPYAFRVPMRAVTEADYATIAERKPGIQRAAATFRWTGSWYTVYLMADQFAGSSNETNEAFENALLAHIEPFRMAGYDLEADAPRYVSIDLALEICAHSDYFRDDVRQGVLRALGNRVLSGGKRGLFHPDNFTFGQSVYLSTIYQAAQAVPGVASVDIVRFGQLDVIDQTPLRDGVLRVEPIEIARLDNDPDFPDHGKLTLTVRGGK